MQQFINVWTALDSRKRVLVGLATIAMFAAVLALSRMATNPSLSLLYAGLDGAPAGEVVSALEQTGVAYEIRGGSIFVDSTQRDQLRMTLASQGLPANSAQGYELLDSLTGFGTTSQMFDAAYWRAKEGELARTIMASPGVQSARVHIAQSSSNPFQRDVKPTASVSISSSSGMTSDQARALKFLVASAVPGLMADEVAIINGQGELVGTEDDKVSSTSDDKATALRERVQRLVEARVGHGNAVVEVSVDTNTESESIVERSFNPDSRIAISVDTQETTNTSNETGGGDVTVASNLPEGDAGGDGNSSSQNSETRERVNYEVSQTTREIIRAAGAIKRISVAVLVNGTQVTGADGAQTFAPLPEEELQSLRDLVASAVGFDEPRGDSITIRSMQFEPREVAGTLGQEPSIWQSFVFHPVHLIQMAVLGLVALILGLFVVRPVLTSRPMPALPPPSPEAQLPAKMAPGGANLRALTGEIDDGKGHFTDIAVVNSGGSPAGEDPVDRLRNLIGERQEETVEILRSWLDTKEEKV